MSLFQLFFIIFATWLLFLHVTFVYGEITDFEPPQDFPPGLDIKITKYVNWADDIMLEKVWTAYPRSALDVVDVANWALLFGYKVRASGHMHNWSPLTVGGRDLNSSEHFIKDNAPPKVILLKTSDYMTRVKVTPIEKRNTTKWGNWTQSSRGGTFWAETGISLFDLTEILEENDLSFLSHPATGTITLGGILAIGGHGAGVPAVGEKKAEGHTYGSLSNLIISLTAVVYDETLQSFTLKTFHRSDVESKVFLVSLGRFFITNVTMRVGPLQFVECQSIIDIKATELFAPPESTSPYTFSKFLDKAGRVETILFPFTNRPWLKVWKVFDKRFLSSKAHPTRRPYNFPFCENMPKNVALLVNEITVSNRTSKAVALGKSIYSWVASNLQNPRSRNFAGAARNSLLYIKASTLRMTANGYAILTSRSQVQRILHDTYQVYNNLLDGYKKKLKFPINGPLEIRVSGIDDPRDVGIEGAESPALSALHPNFDHPEFDTIIWVDILTFARTPGINHFMRDFEDFLVSTYNQNCDYAKLRVEWSKGWGYCPYRPWSNTKFVRKVIPLTFPHWNFTLDTFRKYDPHKVFTNAFLRVILP